MLEIGGSPSHAHYLKVLSSWEVLWTCLAMGSQILPSHPHAANFDLTLFVPPDRRKGGNTAQPHSSGCLCGLKNSHTQKAKRETAMEMELKRRPGKRKRRQSAKPSMSHSGSRD